MQKQASSLGHMATTAQPSPLLLSFIWAKKLPELLSTTQSARDNWKQQRVAHEINTVLKALPSTMRASTLELFATSPDNCRSKLGLKVFLNSTDGKNLLM